jgi:amino acid adenylation domain-containing protein
MQDTSTIKGYRLSPQQKHLWVLQQNDLRQPYRAHCTVLIEGNLDREILTTAVKKVVRRHEILRTTFHCLPGMTIPLQTISDRTPLSIAYLDLSNFNEQERETKIKTLVKEVERSFDFEQGLILHLSLVTLSPFKHKLFIDLPALYADTITLQNLVSEISRAYKADFDRQELTDEPMQYILVSEWQNELLETEEAEIGKDYWHQKEISNFLGLKLPWENSSSKTLEFRPRSLANTIAPNLVTKLKSLVNEYNTTVSSFLLTCWQILLWRLTGSVSAIAVACDGRMDEELESALGLFVKYLPIDSQLEENLRFSQVLQQIDATVREAYEWQECFDWERVGLVNNTDVFFFPFCFDFTECHIESGADVSFSICDRHAYCDRFKVKLSCISQDNSLITEFHYDAELLAEREIERLSEQFSQFVENVIEKPTSTISELEILSSRERQQLLVDFNQTKTDYPKDRCIHQLFEEQAKRTPDNIAVICGDRQLTYAQLNQKANQLAHYLKQQGVSAEVLVGICVERSLDMIVGLLGILKAGGVYVPLDPAYPQNRLAFMLEDARVSLLLTQEKLVTKLPEKNSLVICLDRDWNAIAQEPKNNLVSETTSNNLAYVMYTSGSTGKPKGVMISHQGLVNYLTWCTQAYAVEKGGGSPVQSSIGFDATITSLYSPLLVGQKVVLLPEKDEIEALSQILSSNNNFSLVKLTPAHLELLSQLLPNKEAESQTRALIVGGEALLEKTLSFWRTYTPQTRIINEYGPTETVVGCCVYEVSEQNSLSGTIPIGRPIANTELYILDKHLQPVPIGVPGELYIGGVGVARGYFNRPELTGERFLPNPYGNEPGTRLYKTGDKARYLSDGNIEYLGRIDNQVKIRSFRIELGEIEAVLTQHPGVREAVVLAWEDNPGDKRLVSYLVPDPQYEANSASNSTTEAYSDRVSQWQQVFNNTYSQSAPEGDLTFNTLGWNESYTGLPIAKEEMREWLDSTVERILVRHPKRLLEIGCGTGLLLLRIAPHCARYFGTDISRSALDNIERQIAKLESPWSQVTLALKSADNLEDITPKAFDGVILNSVVQYFPSIDYLVKVLESAANKLDAGGFIFVGDVRSLPLLEAFHADVQLHKAPGSLSKVDLRQRVQTNINEEEELAIAPAFFYVLKQHLPQISHVRVQLKRGRYHNELTRFRYDVILYVGTEVYSTVEPQYLDWQENKLTLSTICQRLRETQPEILIVKNVPNTRVRSQLRLVELLKSNEEFATADELRQALQQSFQEKGIDPEDFWSLSGEFPYTIDINWSDTDVACYDVVFKQSAIAFPIVQKSFQQKPWNEYANNPQQGKLSRQLIPQLRSFLQENLPDYMIPSAFMRMKAFPLTSNGKVNRCALPTPDTSRHLEGDLVAPRDRIEEVLAQIWLQVLGVERLGVYDNFFELGGHSLLATQVISHIRDTLKVELPLRRLFESPTIAGLAAGIRESRETEPGRKAPPILPVSRDRKLPLSFAQQRLWLLDRLQLGDISYNSSATVRLVGSLNIGAMERSFNEIVRRHEVLRTNFYTIDGQPFQAIAPSLTMRLPLIDLCELPKEMRSQQAQKLTTQWCQQPFDLDRDPMLRLMLLKLDEQEHILVFSIHHIASDGWSVGLFIKEVAALYQAFSQNKPSPLPDLPIQYADFAIWQRQWLQGEVLETQLAYWKKQLGTKPLVLELPECKAHSTTPSLRGANYSFILPQALTEALKTLSQQESATLFMTLLGAFKTLLYSYQGQEDIVVGSPIANRNQSETEALIGFFVNTLVLRTDLSGDPSFRQVLQRLQEVSLGAYAHQDLPFEKLVMELQPERQFGINPLFKVWFALQNNPMPPLALPGLTLSLSDVDIEAVRHDLKLGLTETPEGMECLFQYKTDLFEADAIARMAERYKTILSKVVKQPEIQLSTLRAILVDAQKQQQLAKEEEFKASRRQKLGNIHRDRKKISN